MGGLIGCQYAQSSMSEHKSHGNKSSVKIDDLPLEIQQLNDIMLGIQPDWNVFDWIAEKALMEMELIECDLEKERLHAEQRLHRIQDLARRFPENETEDPYQRNLFDCFDVDDHSTFTRLSDRAQLAEEHDAESAFVNMVVDVNPDTNFDDPLLAISCQIILMGVEKSIAKGQPFATIETMIHQAKSHNLSAAETEEALDFLISTGQLIEIDDDCFILNDFDDGKND